MCIVPIGTKTVHGQTFFVQFKPGMLKSISCLDPAVALFLQEKQAEPLRLVANKAPLRLAKRRNFPHDLLERTSLVSSNKGMFPTKQEIHQHSTSPYVDFWSDLLFSSNLRSLIENRSSVRLVEHRRVSRRNNIKRKPKVTDLNFTRKPPFRTKNIGWSNISVDNTFIMCVRHSSQDSRHYISSGCFRKILARAAQRFRESAAFHEIHHNIYISLV
mmetsp:Transcript_2808/g.5189  ORF Transcript_2808/g.5189 Transcript_2808/m.5189 type:complete len:216 (+) Transcript_2808:530-1177(+)